MGTYIHPHPPTHSTHSPPTYLLDVVHWVVLVVLAELDHLGQHAVLDVGQGDLLGVGAVVVCRGREGVEREEEREL